MNHSPKSESQLIKLEFSVLIKQPIEKVFAFLANPENETQWQPDLTEARFVPAALSG